MNSTNIIYWNNITTPIEPSILESYITFIKANMTGLIPVYPEEIAKLKSYANTHQISLGTLLSIRNQIKIQLEIKRSKYVEQNKSKIIYIFENLIKKPNLDLPDIMNFYARIKYPVHAVLKIISGLDSFKNLDHNLIKKFYQIIKDINQIEHKSKILSEQFEHIVEKFISKQHISFRTEADLRYDRTYNLTPDILFDQPVTININGTNHQIRWLDAKNFVFMGPYMPHLYKKIISQAKKYNEVFGPGAFIFRYGVVDGIQIDGAYLLDGSQL